MSNENNNDDSLKDLPEDESLKYLEELEDSAFGRAWIQYEDEPEYVSKRNPEPKDEDVVIGPLPRRKLIASKRQEFDRDQYVFQSTNIDVSFFRIAQRIAIWLWFLLRWSAREAIARLQNQSSPKEKAVRLRETFESLGTTFIKLGQQLSLRADLIDQEYCNELGKMLDEVPPFSTDIAIELIEKNLARPLTDVFSVFDPSPIGSGSLACVYQAILRTNQQRVAIKVRRPGIQKLLAADIAAMRFMLLTAEYVTLIRSGTTKHLYTELMSMLYEETNFRKEARYTDIFRSEAAASSQDYVSAPKIYFEYSTEEILVSEFVEGIFLHEILAACDNNDKEALRLIRNRGIDIRSVARNLVLSMNWETGENLLFHGDPHPANVVVQPGNRIVFIDFGTCGRATSRSRRLWQEWQWAAANSDVGGMTQASISLLEPLPPLDIYSFRKEIEALYWDLLYANKSTDAEWWEKASGVMWIKFISIARRYNVPMNLETLKWLRVTFIFDTIIFRLWAQLDLQKEYRRYQKQAARRARKRVRKLWKKRWRKGLLDEDYFRLEELSIMTHRIRGQIQNTLETPSHKFGATINKAFYVILILLQTTVFGLSLQLIFVLAYYAYVQQTGADLAVVDVMLLFLGHPLYQAFLICIFLFVIRKINLRLGDYDVNR